MLPIWVYTLWNEIISLKNIISHFVWFIVIWVEVYLLLYFFLFLFVLLIYIFLFSLLFYFKKLFTFTFPNTSHNLEVFDLKSLWSKVIIQKKLIISHSCVEFIDILKVPASHLQEENSPCQMIILHCGLVKCSICMWTLLPADQICVWALFFFFFKDGGLRRPPRERWMSLSYLCQPLSVPPARPDSGQKKSPATNGQIKQWLADDK